MRSINNGNNIIIIVLWWRIMGEFFVGGVISRDF